MAVDATATVGLAFLALVIGNVALAFGPWFVRLADVGPVAAGFWRITLAMPLLAALALARGARPVAMTRGMWAMLAIGGVAFAADLASWHLGILRTTMTNATLFGNAAILIYPIYGFLAARSWPTRAQGIALALAAIGAGLLMGRSYQVDPRNFAGDLLCIVAGILYTVYFIVMAQVRATMRPLPALALASAATALPLLVFALLLHEQVTPQHWTPLLGLALVSQVLGQGCMIFALGQLSPLVVGIGLLVQPIVAGAVGWIEYGERLQGPDWVGVALVALALVLVRRAEVAPARTVAQEVGS
ncbi:MULTISPECIES: DMT family transporter [unclassified Sphingomonas]|uniref:DMT family transporter n=1 Tax=Sphingomonas sp. TaxID=28214 RepID=UPI0025F5EE35|nr:MULTISPECIES: DMT family transporter [unclassified Sphingomonas]